METIRPSVLLRRALRDAGRETSTVDRLRQGSGESAEALRAKAERRTSKEVEKAEPKSLGKKRKDED